MAYKDRQQNVDAVREWRRRNKDRVKAHELKKNYGISLEQFNELLVKQDGRCAVCGEIPERPNVDHDHKTKVVRGILCTNCNLMLGHAGDSVEILQKATQYLSRSYSYNP